jgi:hypothetical protein
MQEEDEEKDEEQNQWLESTVQASLDPNRVHLGAELAAT